MLKERLAKPADDPAESKPRRLESAEIVALLVERVTATRTTGLTGLE